MSVKSIFGVVGFLVAALCAQSATPKITRVACIGDSITEGSGTSNFQFEAYPSQLQRMLDPDKWLVGNFGSSGRTLLKNGDCPYQTQGALPQALQFNPDIVIIMLGTNDTKPQNWKLKDQFVPDYKDLVAKFKALPTHPRIFVCRPPVVPGEGNYGINEPVIKEQIPLIDQIARDERVGVIDMHAATAGHDKLFPDRVHPNADGANLLARAAYQGIIGKPFSGELSTSLQSDWFGYRRLDSRIGDRIVILVQPKTPALGNPWIWRTEFFGTEPQADLALLAKGYHVAYCDLQNMYGSPAALDLMDTFYKTLTQSRPALSPKVTLEGFSRGGLYAFNWAARHPDRVASIYADAPVCDFKSWPAGKGKGQGSPEDWQRLLNAYSLTEAQALAYKLNPVDHLAPLATARIPIIIVCGDADKTVPYEENAALVESRYKMLGGTIKVIVKPGGDHHPHSLSNPAPIVDFILAHPAR